MKHVKESNNERDKNSSNIQSGMGVLQEVAIGEILADTQLKETTIEQKKGNG